MQLKASASWRHHNAGNTIGVPLQKILLSVNNVHGEHACVCVCVHACVSVCVLADVCVQGSILRVHGRKCA